MDRLQAMLRLKLRIFVHVGLFLEDKKQRMITKKQYLTARRWLDTHKELIDKYQSQVREYNKQPNRTPYEGVKPNTLIQDIPEFNRFNIGAIKDAFAQFGLANYPITVSDFQRKSVKEWSERYGIGSGTIAKIKAAVEAAGLKMRRK